jgi:O-antigen ligase
MTVLKAITTKNNINALLLMLIGLFFVFKVTLSTPFIIILLLLNFKDNKPKTALTKRLFITFCLCYALFLTAALYNKTNEFAFVYKTLGLVFIPILFLRKTLNEKEIFFFAASFLISNLLYIIYLDFLVFKSYVHTAELGFSQFFYADTMPNRIYFTLNILLAIMCLKFIFDAKKINVGLFFLVLSFIGINLILIGSRVSFFTGLILLVILVFDNIKVKKLYALVSFLLLILCVVFFAKESKARLATSSEDPRFGIWHCAYTIYKDPNFDLIIGEFSNLKTDKRLIDCYNSKEVLSSSYAYMKDYNFNSHNQFIWFFLCFGLIGLVIYVAFFAIHLFHFLNKKNWYSCFFILIFFIQSLFENIIVRQQGIYIFAWFAFLFVDFGRKQIPSKNEQY